ncbi:separin [Nilaparvata lugens]|uniref:separin n=1 Tax=Nilaparvata lugens TaxID=108931 RepID=UPI00193DF9E6|nr:separin [Nilaparvata lugens]XP_039292975.1 separin [Nilaparvata lugens]
MFDAAQKSECEGLIDDFKENVMRMMSSVTLINGPVYARYNRILAHLCLLIGREQEAIFHLTESHAVTFRISALKLSEDCEDEQSNSSVLPRSSLKSDYFSFSCSKFQNGSEKLKDRLKCLPSEWTLVQLTFDHDETESWFKTSDTKMLPLHITRLPCGNMLSKNRRPVTITLTEAQNTNKTVGTISILEQVNQLIKQFNATGLSNTEKRQKRANADKQMKQVVGELITSWLKEWSCLLIGRLKDTKLEQKIVDEVDRFIKNYKKPDENVMDVEKVRTVLYQVVDCCAHSSETFIRSAIEYCVRDKILSDSFVKSILNFKKQHTTALMRALRHPVLLILDDRLECIPWEMTSVLLKHPVSRVSSLHVACALFDKHRQKMKNGIVVINETKSGFYVVNPDKDLVSTEKIISDFIGKRKLGWEGVAGEKPSSKQVIRSLHENKVFLYSGHGNGCHFLDFDELERTHITVIPMLFGCSSASKKRIGEGGISELWGVSDQYLLAGSPCYFGMLWSALNIPTNVLTLAFLNICLPGVPINVNEVFGQDVIDDDVKQELELLRAVRPAKAAVSMYMNAAAFIARGIPVAFTLN